MQGECFEIGRSRVGQGLSLGCLLSSVAIAIALFFAPAATTAPGDLDAAFGGTGRSRQGFGVADDARLNDMVVQADGRIVAIGESNLDMVAVRLMPDGSPDSSFGENGVVSIPFGAPSAANAVALQEDGKIVLAGEMDGQRPEFAAARLNSNGTLDTSFSEQQPNSTPAGRIVTALGPESWATGWRSRRTAKSSS